MAPPKSEEIGLAGSGAVHIRLSASPHELPKPEMSDLLKKLGIPIPKQLLGLTEAAAPPGRSIDTRAKSDRRKPLKMAIDSMRLPSDREPRSCPAAMVKQIGSASGNPRNSRCLENALAAVCDILSVSECAAEGAMLRN